MMNPENRFDEMISALKERDFRLTPQRMELVRMIATTDGHPNASQLYSKIKTRFPTMSHATVYKTLGLLKELNQVFEIDLHDDSHYDGKKPFSHPHLICTCCEKIMDGDSQLERQMIKQVENQSGFLIAESKLVFYGVCPDCQKLGS
jgi:Fur family peroxide stress response transcriptional regulator